MSNISIKEFERLLDYNVNDSSVIEVYFSVKNSKRYSSCWLGKMSNETNREPIYWFGLTEDGKSGYDFMDKNEMINAKVFSGRSIKEIWDSIEIISVNGLEPNSVISAYISEMQM